MSRIRTNFITNRMANGAPTVSNGLVISGVTTCNSTANQTLLLNNTTSNGQSSIAFQSAGSTKYTLGSNKEGDGNIDFFIYDQINGKHRFNIQADGAIGINSTSPTANYKLDVNGDLSLGEKFGTDNTYIDQKQDGDLHIINSGRGANDASPTSAGGVGINRYNNISGATSFFRDFTVYSL